MWLLRSPHGFAGGGGVGQQGWQPAAEQIRGVTGGPTNGRGGRKGREREAWRGGCVGAQRAAKGGAGGGGVRAVPCHGRLQTESAHVSAAVAPDSTGPRPPRIFFLRCGPIRLWEPSVRARSKWQLQSVAPQSSRPSVDPCACATDRSRPAGCEPLLLATGTDYIGALPLVGPYRRSSSLVVTFGIRPELGFPAPHVGSGSRAA
eukprot:scaffold225_cov388-Prasinococcus_capsulatus_cf.AAC.2